MRVLFLYQLGSVDHDLIVDAGQSVDDLVEHLDAGVLAFGLFRNDFEDVPVEIEGVFELGNFIF
jgi:hypothetical protein